MHNGILGSAEVAVVPEVEKDSEEMNEIAAEDANPCVKKKNPETHSMKGVLIKESVESLGSHLPEVDMGFIGDVMTTVGELHFVTGSSYQGTWDAIGMTGIGRYVMPHCVVYEGEFRDGMFHGNGTLEWPQNQRIDGIWKRGKLQEFHLTFADGLAFESSNWKYCEFPDRRFHIHTKNDVQPAGRTLKTRMQPTRIIPAGCYDTGDGVFDPRTYCVTSYENPKKVLRIPKRDERDWIVENCRKAWYEPTGYRSDLEEAYKEDVSDKRNLPLSKESPNNWWKRMTTFERDIGTSSDHEELKSKSEFGESDNAVLRPKTCACRGFGRLGESCYCILLRDSRSQSYNGEAEEYKDDLQEGREIFCDEMNEFDGENSWKLLGTVCGPKESSHSVVSDFEIKASVESYWSGEENIWDDKIEEEEVWYEIEAAIPKRKLMGENEDSERMDTVRFKQSEEETIEGEEDIDEKIFDSISDDENEEIEGDWQEVEEEKIHINKNMEQEETENEVKSRMMESKVIEAKEEAEDRVEIENEKDINKDEEKEEEEEREIERRSKFNEYFAIEKEQMEYEEMGKTDLIDEIEEIEKAEENSEAKEIEEMDEIEKLRVEEVEQLEDNGERRKTSEVKETKESTRGKENEFSSEPQEYPESVNKQEESLQPDIEFSWESKKKLTPLAALEEQENWDVQSREKIKDDKEMEKEVELHDEKFFESEQQIFQDKLQRGEKLGIDEKESVELEEKELQGRISFFRKTIPRANEETFVPDFRSPRWNIEFVRKRCDVDVCMKKSSETTHPSKKCGAGRLPVNLPSKIRELQMDEHKK